MLRASVERMELSPTEIIRWARPRLVNLSNTLLPQFPSAGFPNEQQRIVAEYRLAFQQRINGALREAEIGFVRGSSFSERQPINLSAATERKDIVSLKRSFRVSASTLRSSGNG
jgi:hypothetical protein